MGNRIEAITGQIVRKVKKDAIEVGAAVSKSLFVQGTAEVNRTTNQADQEDWPLRFAFPLSWMLVKETVRHPARQCSVVYDRKTDSVKLVPDKPKRQIV